MEKDGIAGVPPREDVGRGQTEKSPALLVEAGRRREARAARYRLEPIEQTELQNSWTDTISNRHRLRDSAEG